MKKLFLIPLMAMLCTVMAWGTEIVVNNFNDLKTALSSTGTADEVKLGQDITYEGTAVLDIQRSLTLDGQGHKLIGFKQTAIKTDGTSEKHWTSIAVNAGQFGSTTELDVTIKNLSLGNTTTNARYYGIVAFDGVKELTLDNINIVCSDYSAQQPLCFTGTSATPIDLTIKDSYIYSGKSAYPAYILKPINATLKNSTFEGYCALYFKYRASPMYGSVVGARGSVVNADACAFNAPNVHSGSSNAFAVFPMEDDGITLNLNNCSYNAQQIGDQYQSWVSVQYRTRKNANHPITIKITGDNTHMYNINKDKIIDIEDSWTNGYKSGTQDADLGTGYDITTSLTIEAGTFSLNPNTFAIEQGDGTVNAPVIDDTKYEINEVKQGDATLYRVAKKAATKEVVDPENPEQTIEVLYDLNDLVVNEGIEEGNNPISSFDLSTGAEMTLNQETTTAGYVQVSDKGDDATVIKVGKVVSEEKVDQTLVINNGLDVQGNSQVVVQAGSTLQIGEGGITTEDPDNIVIEADEKGAASLIMDPAITVNQTPNLTVKMKAKNIGWMNVDGEKSYFWHRFALPIQQATTWQKSPNKSTYVYGWNYSQDQWEQYGALTQMVPFKGYTLTADYENLGDVEYTFTGQLAGNTNNNLQFERNGFNFFGNSYTGYIDILALVEQLMGDDKIDGSVWVWGSDQNYHAVPLQTLRDGGDVYATEIAPMQTFILKQNGGENATAELNYAAAVWGNPRYGNSTPAPARAIANDDTRMRIIVTADNGKSDFVMFTEADRFSDAFEKGYDGVKYMNERAINMYTTLDGEDYSNVATDNLIGKKLNIQTVNTLNYTISFAKVNGEEYALRDNVTGSIIAIREGNTYTFSAQPNATIGGRFEIVNMDMVATQIENTEVNAGVKGIYTMLGQYVGEDFNALPAGIYVVDGVKIVK